MIRSRLFLLFLLLAYLLVTPIGVYTCVCFVPDQPVLTLAQADWDHIPEQSLLPDTAVATIMSFLSLSFLLVVALSVAKRHTASSTYGLFLLRPYEYKLPPLTPPPQIA